MDGDATKTRHCPSLTRLCQSNKYAFSCGTLSIGKQTRSNDCYVAVTRLAVVAVIVAEDSEVEIEVEVEIKGRSNHDGEVLTTRHLPLGAKLAVLQVSNVSNDGFSRLNVHLLPCYRDKFSYSFILLHRRQAILLSFLCVAKPWVSRQTQKLLSPNSCAMT